jgi:hypothetical protein
MRSKRHATLPVVTAACVIGLLTTVVPAGEAAGADEGALDPTWSGDGIAVGDSEGIGYGIAVQSTGKAVIAVYPAGGGMSVMRFTKNGALDTTFGDGGTARVPDTAYPAYADPSRPDLSASPSSRWIASLSPEPST